MSKLLEIINNGLRQVKNYSPTLSYEDILVMSGKLEELIINHINEKHHINIEIETPKDINTEFQTDLKDMQEAVEKCACYCPFQPSNHFRKQYNTPSEVLIQLSVLKDQIGDCRCMVDINKYIEKYEGY